jgi:phage terminase large subunit-like protein
MSEHGINMLQYSQSIAAFNRPTKMIEMLLLKEEIKIQKNPCLLWNFRNVVLLTGQNDNVKPVKANANSDNKIDGVISLIM